MKVIESQVYHVLHTNTYVSPGDMICCCAEVHLGGHSCGRHTVVFYLGVIVSAGDITCQVVELQLIPVVENPHLTRRDRSFCKANAEIA